MSTTYTPRHRAPPERRAAIMAAISLGISILAAALAAVAIVIALTPARTAVIHAPTLPAPTVSASAPAHTTPGPAASQRPPQHRTASVLRYVVRPGDSLWLIALHTYGTGFAWGRIYAANRTVIGSRPGHITPGTVLTIPRT